MGKQAIIDKRCRQLALVSLSLGNGWQVMKEDINRHDVYKLTKKGKNWVIFVTYGGSNTASKDKIFFKGLVPRGGEQVRRISVNETDSIGNITKALQTRLLPEYRLIMERLEEAVPLFFSTP